MIELLIRCYQVSHPPAVVKVSSARTTANCRASFVVSPHLMTILMTLATVSSSSKLPCALRMSMVPAAVLSPCSHAWATSLCRHPNESSTTFCGQEEWGDTQQAASNLESCRPVPAVSHCLAGDAIVKWTARQLRAAKMTVRLLPTGIQLHGSWHGCDCSCCTTPVHAAAVAVAVLQDQQLL